MFHVRLNFQQASYSVTVTERPISLDVSCGGDVPPQQTYPLLAAYQILTFVSYAGLPPVAERF